MSQPPSNREEVSRWLSTLPTAWTLQRGKFLMREVDRRSASGSEVLLSLSKSRGVIRRDEISEGGGRADTLVGYKVVRPGDLVMNKMQAWNGLFGRSRLDGLVSPDYSVFETLPGVDQRWLTYCLQSEFLVGQFAWRSRGMGTAFLRLHPENLLDTPIPVPPRDDQRAIADFLDAETARINDLVKMRRAMLQLLDHRLRSTVALAFERLGHASPARPVRSFARIQLGRQRSPDNDDGPFMVPYLRAANVKDGSLDLADVKKMNFTPSEQMTFSLEEGDVLISEGAGSLAAVGASAVWHNELGGPICFQNTLIRLRALPGTDPNFLAWWCRYAFYCGLFAAISGGANIYHVSADRVRTLLCPSPHLSEQGPVSRHLNEVEAHTRKVSTVIERQIDALVERRQSLITAIVTGQIPVPGAA